MKKLLILTSAAGAIAVSNAYAAAGDAGWYGGLSVGRSIEHMGGAGIDTALGAQGAAPGASLDRRDFSGSLFGGYSFSPNFALEGGLTSLGRLDFTGPVSGHYSASGAELDALGLLPVAERWSLYGKAGLFYGRSTLEANGARVHDWDTSPVLGLGASYDLSRSVAARFGVDRYFNVGEAGTTGRGDIDQYTVGLVYRFR